MPSLPPALRYRDFAVYWSGAGISAFGSQFTQVAMSWQIYDLTGSAMQIGLLGLARAAPQMGLVLFGGLLADTLDRRRLLMFTQVAQFFVSSSLFTLTFMHAITPLALFIASGLLALFTALSNPARQSFIPSLVPRQHLSNAIAISSTQRNVGRIVGPSLAGVLLAASGPGWCYFVDALSWAAIVVALLMVRTRQAAEVGDRGVAVEALLEGFRFSLSQPVLMSFIVLDFGANFFGSPVALLPVYARDIFHVGADGLGVMYAASSCGGVIAAIALSVMGQPRRAGLWVLIGLGFYGLCAMGFALSPTFWVAALLLAGIGAGDTVNAVLRMTVAQLVTPDALRGRVSALNSLFTSGGPQLGQFESGMVAGWWGAESAFSGGLATLLLVLSVAAVPAVRRFNLAPPARPAVA